MRPFESMPNKVSSCLWYLKYISKEGELLWRGPVKGLGKVKVKLLPFSWVRAIRCSFERKVMLQLITDNEVNIIGAETMMWSNAKKWLTAEKILCEPKQFPLTCNFIHPTNNISSQFYQWNAISPRSFCQRQGTASNHFVHTNKSIVDYYFLPFGIQVGGPNILSKTKKKKMVSMLTNLLGEWNLWLFFLWHVLMWGGINKF